MKTITESVNKGFENKYGQLEMGYKGSKRRSIRESREDDITIKEAELKGRLDFLKLRYTQGRLDEEHYLIGLEEVVDTLNAFINSFKGLK